MCRFKKNKNFIMQDFKQIGTRSEKETIEALRANGMKI